MGESTFVSRKRDNKQSKANRVIHLGFDVPLLLVVFTLVIFGILMVYSASWDFSLAIYGSSTEIFTRQLTWLAIGVGVAILLAFLDYHIWQHLVVFAMLLVIVLLSGVLLTNEVRFGAARSLLQGSIQPSELAKLVTVIYLSVWLYSKRDRLNDVNFGLIPLAGILGVVGGLIFLQPDLSAVATVILLGVLLFFLVGGELKQIVLFVFATLVVGWFVVKISPTGSDRVAGFFTALDDPTQASYHLRRSFEAFVKGGWFGVGIGRANTKLTGLPVPPTDSIFAVVGEETGVLGASGLVILFSLLAWRGLGIARRAPDSLGMLLAAGLSIWIVMEAFINMAVMVGLLPFAGNALPFISSGGSSLVVSLAAIGILMNISRMAKQKEDQVERSLSAVVDLRRRKRRRGVSRPSRPAGAQEKG
jgi:cell division protein FtsW